jgi:hypothetical protein
LSFTLAPGWMMADDTDDSERTWRGPDNTRFFFLGRATHLQSRKTNYQYAGWLDANARHVTFITGAWRNFMMTKSILRCKPAEIDTGKHQCARAIFCAIVIQLLMEPTRRSVGLSRVLLLCLTPRGQVSVSVFLVVTTTSVT